MTQSQLYIFLNNIYTSIFISLLKKFYLFNKFSYIFCLSTITTLFMIYVINLKKVSDKTRKKWKLQIGIFHERDQELLLFRHK